MFSYFKIFSHSLLLTRLYEITNPISLNLQLSWLISYICLALPFGAGLMRLALFWLWLWFWCLSWFLPISLSSFFAPLVNNFMLIIKKWKYILYLRLWVSRFKVLWFSIVLPLVYIMQGFAANWIHLSIEIIFPFRRGVIITFFQLSQIWYTTYMLLS